MQLDRFLLEMRVKAEEEAYWAALDRVFGTSARALKALLLARVPPDGLSERSVSRLASSSC